MFFEIHMTLVDGVTGSSPTRFSSSLGTESGDCSRSAPVSTFVTLVREKANLDFGRYFATTKA